MKRSMFVLSLVLLAACGKEDVPQAHKGMMFDRTGALAFYSGGDGLEGDILSPGTYYTGIYDEVRVVECSPDTVKEELTSLTKDGVQFGLDVYVTMNVNCDDAVVKQLFNAIAPTKGRVISREQLYATYVRPALGEAVREAIATEVANDINGNREAILKKVREQFDLALKERTFVQVTALVISNMDYPEAMDKANTERAVQAVLKDKAIAEREKVEAEIETAKQKQDLSLAEGKVEAAKIDEIGAALRRNPEFLQYDMQLKMPGIYAAAGANGNMIIAAPAPQVLVTPTSKAAPKGK